MTVCCIHSGLKVFNDWIDNFCLSSNNNSETIPIYQLNLIKSCFDCFCPISFPLWISLNRKRKISLSNMLYMFKQIFIENNLCSPDMQNLLYLRGKYEKCVNCHKFFFSTLKGTDTVINLFYCYICNWTSGNTYNLQSKVHSTKIQEKASQWKPTFSNFSFYTERHLP